MLMALRFEPSSRFFLKGKVRQKKTSYILANRKESVCLSREKMWIRHVHTIHPHGLNIQEGTD